MKRLSGGQRRYETFTAKHAEHTMNRTRAVLSGLSGLSGKMLISAVLWAILICVGCGKDKGKGPPAADIAPSGMVEVEVRTLGRSVSTLAPFVLLGDPEAETGVVIWIGESEAWAIFVTLEGVDLQRPMTHDLMKTILEGMGGRMIWVAVTDMQEDIYMAEMTIQTDRTSLCIDARPSDAIALALRTSAPIYVAEDVMELYGVPVMERESAEKWVPGH